MEEANLILIKFLLNFEDICPQLRNLPSQQHLGIVWSSKEHQDKKTTHERYGGVEVARGGRVT
jgi:hypothetical protein